MPQGNSEVLKELRTSAKMAKTLVVLVLVVVLVLID